MTLAAMIPIARVAEHNLTLNGLGFGPENFSVPVRNISDVHTHTALCYAGANASFIAAVKALLGVQVVESNAEPQAVMDALAGGRGAWQRQ